MQAAALGVLAWEISGSSGYLGAIIFANLGPLALLSLVGGSLEIRVIGAKFFLNANLATCLDDSVSSQCRRWGDRSNSLLIIVFIIGLGQGVYANITSVIPELAGRNNLQAAVALNSMSMNGARDWPGSWRWLTSRFGYAEVFSLNAVTYLFVLVAIILTTIPPTSADPRNLGDRLFGGFGLRQSSSGRKTIDSYVSLFLLLFAIYWSTASNS